MGKLIPARIRIVSDGTGEGTRILDADGNVLPITSHIQSLEWRIGPRPEHLPATVVLTLCYVDVDLYGTVTPEAEA